MEEIMLNLLQTAKLATITTNYVACFLCRDHFTTQINAERTSSHLARSII
jgi:hypothetical protein